jgi:hypothetical protein
MLFGFRGLLNNDREQRTDPAGSMEGTAQTAEYRLGASVSPWKSAWVDVGGTALKRRNSLAGTHTLVSHPNLGFEQALLDTHLGLRFGLDETSPTAGLSLKFVRYKLDAAYVDNMARSRVGNLFGDHSRSFLVTFTIDYGAKPLRANISETLPVVVINEQGEEEKNKDEQEFSWCCLRGRGWCGTKRRRA